MAWIGSEDWWVPKGTSLVSENIGAFNDYPVYSPEPLTVAPQQTSSLYQERIYYPSSDTSGRYYSDDGGDTWNWENFDRPPVQPEPFTVASGLGYGDGQNDPGGVSAWGWSETPDYWQQQNAGNGGLWNYAMANPGDDSDIIDHRPTPAFDLTGVGFSPYGDPTYWEDGSWSNPFTGAPQNWIDPSQVEPGDADQGLGGFPYWQPQPGDADLGIGGSVAQMPNYDWGATYPKQAFANQFNEIPGEVWNDPSVQEGLANNPWLHREDLTFAGGLQEVAQEFTPMVWGDDSAYGGRSFLRGEGYVSGGPGQAPIDLGEQDSQWARTTGSPSKMFGALANETVLPDDWLNPLPNWKYAPVEDMARTATSPLGLASLAVAPIGGVGRGLAAEALGTYGSMVAPELAQDAGIEDPRLLTASALLGGLAGGVAGFKAPEIGGGIKKAGSAFEGALESIQPTQFDEFGNMIGGSEFGGGRFGPLKKGDPVTGPDGTSYVVAKNTEGVPTSMVSVVDETGAEASIRRTMLDDGGTPNQSMVDYLDTEKGLRNQGIPQSEIHEGRIRQAQMFDESFARATEEGLTGRDLAIRVREDLRGQRMRQTLPEDIDPGNMARYWNELHAASENGELGRFDFLDATKALFAIENRIGLQPKQRELLNRIFGDGFTEAAEGNLGKLKVENPDNPFPTRPLDLGDESVAAQMPLSPDVPKGNLAKDLPTDAERVGVMPALANNPDAPDLQLIPAMPKRFAHVKPGGVTPGEGSPSFIRKAAKAAGLAVAESVLVSRATQTAFDISMILRQGAMLGWRQPTGMPGTFTRQFKMWASADVAKAEMKAILERPNAPIYKAAKVHLLDFAGDVNQQEEMMMSRIIGKIPGVRNSARAYTVGLNRLRADSFDRMWNSLDPTQQTLEVAEQLGRLVNVASGRGSLLGALEGSGPLLNTIFYATRNLISKPEMLWLVVKPNQSAIARKEAMKILASYFVGTSTLLSLGTLPALWGGTPLWEVNLDPRSAEFGKAKINMGPLGKLGPMPDTITIDPWGGYVQMARMFAQFTTGERVDSEGNVQSMHRADALTRFGRGKLAPLPGEVISEVTGRDYRGREVRPVWEDPLRLVNFYAPISAKDTYDAYQEYGWEAAAFTLPAYLGLGVQFYEPKPFARRQQDDYERWSPPPGVDYVRPEKAQDDPLFMREWRAAHPDQRDTGTALGEKLADIEKRFNGSEGILTKLNQMAENNEITIGEWKERRKAENDVKREALSNALAELGDKKTKAGTPEHWVKTWGETFANADDGAGGLDSDKLDEAQAAWLAANGDTAYAYVQALGLAGKEGIEYDYLKDMQVLAEAGVFNRDGSRPGPSLPRYQNLKSGMGEYELEKLESQVSEEAVLLGINTDTKWNDKAVLTLEKDGYPDPVIQDVIWVHLAQNAELANPNTHAGGYFLTSEYYNFKAAHPKEFAWRDDSKFYKSILFRAEQD